MLSTTTHHYDGQLPGHRHTQAHVSVVLRGDYIETSIDGRFQCDNDCLIAHPQHHWHTNRFRGHPVDVVNLQSSVVHRYGVYRLSRSARRAILVEQRLEVIGDVLGDTGCELSAIPNAAWIDSVCQALREQPWARLESLARGLGISAAHLSRQFSRATGLRPVQFRAESRARMAVALIHRGEALAQAASGSGYADQSHMCRDLRLRFGRSPAQLLCG